MNSVLLLEAHKNSVLMQNHRNSVRTDRFRVDEHLEGGAVVLLRARGQNRGLAARQAMTEHKAGSERAQSPLQQRRKCVPRSTVIRKPRARRA